MISILNYSLVRHQLQTVKPCTCNHVAFSFPTSSSTISMDVISFFGQCSFCRFSVNEASDSRASDYDNESSHSSCVRCDFITND